jgi:hypothetical protein
VGPVALILVGGEGDSWSLTRGESPAAIRNEIRNDQRGKEEKPAEDEKQQPAVALASGDASWPEGQRQQDDHAHDSPEKPSRHLATTSWRVSTA